MEYRLKKYRNLSLVGGNSA